MNHWSPGSTNMMQVDEGTKMSSGSHLVFCTTMFGCMFSNHFPLLYANKILILLV
jgi:hypothetical protein